MPLYDYRCDSCGAVFEVSHPMSGSCSSCPSCQGTSVHRVVGQVAVRNMKGTDSDLMKLQAYEAGRPQLPGKQRVSRLLEQMKPDSQAADQHESSCIEHTREELREVYGDIIPTGKA